MENHLPLKRWVSAVISAVVLMMGVWLPTAQAGMVGTDDVLAPSHADEQRARIQTMLDREDVRDKLTELGVAPSEVKQRVANLSDAEVQQLAAQMDQAPAGQGVIETVVVMGVFVFLVLLVTDILGFTNVFPFVTSTVN